MRRVGLCLMSDKGIVRTGQPPSDSLDLEKLKAVLTGRLRHESLAALFNVTASGKSTALDRFTCTN